MMASYNESLEKGKRLMQALIRRECGAALALIRDPSTNVNFSAEKKGGSCLHRACMNGSITIVRALLLRKDLNLALLNHHGETAFYLCCRLGYKELVQLLLEDGRSDKNKADYAGNPPIY